MYSSGTFWLMVSKDGSAYPPLMKGDPQTPPMKLWISWLLIHEWLTMTHLYHHFVMWSGCSFLLQSFHHFPLYRFETHVARGCSSFNMTTVCGSAVANGYFCSFLFIFFLDQIQTVLRMMKSKRNLTCVYISVLCCHGDCRLLSRMAGMKEQQITEEKPLLPEQRGLDSDAVSSNAFLTSI